MSFLRRIRGRRLFVSLLAVYGLIAPFTQSVGASTFNVVIFSYNTDYIEQSVNISQYAGQISEWSIEATAKNTQGGPDKLGLGVAVHDASTSAVVEVNNDGGQMSNLGQSWINIALSSATPDSSNWETMTIRIFGKDAENWGGNYGPSVKSISLKLKLNGSSEWTDATSLLTNPDFSSVSSDAPVGWTSNQQWAPCQGVTSATLCVGSLEDVPPTTTTTTSTSTTTTTLPPPQTGLAYKTFASAGGMPSLPSPQSQVITSGTVPSIDYNWGGGQVLDSGRANGVIVEFSGMIRPPVNAVYELCAYTDDGFKLYLNGTLTIDNWYDRGPSCGPAVAVDFTNSESASLIAYYYENGGGAVAQLRYKNELDQWEAIPASWYTSDSISPPTTTTTTTTTTSTTTTTTTSAPTTTLPPLPDNLLWGVANEGWVLTISAPDGYEFNGVVFLSYGTPNGDDGYFTVNNNCHASLSASEINDLIIGKTSFSLAASNSVFGDPCPGTYKALKAAVTYIESAPQTTTTPPTTTVITVPPIIDGGSSGDAGSGEDSSDVPSDESPEDPVDEPQPEPEPEGPVDGEPAGPPTSEDEVPESAPDGENEEPSEEAPVDDGPSDEGGDPTPDDQEPTEPTPEDEAEDTPGEPVEEIADDLTEEEANAVIEEALSDGITESEAASLASSVAVVHELSGQEASQIFATIDIAEITDEQVAEIVEAVQDAPLDVREAFEEEINVFGGGALDNYIPVGSQITVGERRVVIAATGVMLAGVPMPSRAPAPTAPAPAPAAPSSTSASSSSSESNSRKKGR